MKKNFRKPAIEKHFFTMDIHVMSSAERDRYNALLADFLDIYERYPESDEEFQNFIRGKVTSDDPSSGWCYFTSVTPS